VRQRVDPHIALDVVDRLMQASVLVPSMFIAQEPHTPRARAAEGQRGVDLILDLNEGVEDHRAAIGEVIG